MSKLNKVVLNNISNVEVLVVKTDNRVNNTGRPVNKKSARQIRLANQAYLSKLNEQFVGGNKFYINNNEHNVYEFHVGEDKGCIVDEVGMYVCNVKYVGRTKVEGFTYVLGKYVNVKINLKEVTFVK